MAEQNPALADVFIENRNRLPHIAFYERLKAIIVAETNGTLYVCRYCDIVPAHS